MIGRAALVALAVMLACAAPASAHATLESSEPGDTAVLRAQPRVVTLHWSESVDLGKQSVRLLDASGAEVKTAAAVHAGSSGARLTLPPGLARGTYVVAWRVVSADSHPVSGAFSFSVGAPSGVVASAPGDASVAVRALDGIARAVAFAGLALTLGGAVLLLVLWPEGRDSRRGRRIVRGGMIALAAGSLAVLALQGPYAAGGGLLDVFKPSPLSFSLGTRIGHAIVVRLALTALFAWLIARNRLRPAALCGVALIFTWTLTDHSQTGVQTWLGVPAASVHLLAMALWLGGLVLVLACAPAPALPRFSRLALICFGALAVTGVYLSWRQSGELAALPATGFGRLLLIKSAVVAAIAGLAFFSRRGVGRGRSVRRTVAAESVLAVGVLGVTATLVNAAPARVAYAPPFDATVPAHGGPLAGGKIQVHMEPAKQGENVLDVYLVMRDGSLFPAPELGARMLPPGGGGVGPLKVSMGSAEPGHFVAEQLSIPFTGRWRLRLEIRTSDVDETDVEVPVRVR